MKTVCILIVLAGCISFSEQQNEPGNASDQATGISELGATDNGTTAANTTDISATGVDNGNSSRTDNYMFDTNETAIENGNGVSGDSTTINDYYNTTITDDYNATTAGDYNATTADDYNATPAGNYNATAADDYDTTPADDYNATTNNDDNTAVYDNTTDYNNNSISNGDINTTLPDSDSTSDTDNSTTNASIPTSFDNDNTTEKNSGEIDEKETTTPSNVTTAGPETTTPGQPITSEPEDITTQTPYVTTTTPHKEVKPKGVSGGCLTVYTQCTRQYRKNNESYCPSFKLAKPCIVQDNIGDEPDDCTKEEQARLETLDCGPNDVFGGTNGTASDITIQCLDRITECLSVSERVGDLNESFPLASLFCDAIHGDNRCLLRGTAQRSCTIKEYREAVTIAKCTSGTTLISSSIILVAIAFLMQRMLGKV